MIVKNNKVRLKVIPLAGCKKALKHYKVAELVLTPGFNEIPDEVWDELKENFSNIRYALESKDLEEQFAEKTEKDLKTNKKDLKTKQTKGTSFNKLSNEEAEKVIADTWDVKAFKGYAKNESRDDIRNLILDKIKEIKKKDGDDK